jgi:hypothetical protein
VVALACLAGAVGASAKSFNLVQELENYSITLQRQTVYDTPQYQLQLGLVSLSNLSNALAAQLADPGRFFTNDLCWNSGNGCAGDIRLYDWGTKAYGIVRPVLFTARGGATLSGVRPPRAGPKRSARTGAGHIRRRARPDGRAAVLRRHGGRRQLLPVNTFKTLCACA